MVWGSIGDWAMVSVTAIGLGLTAMALRKTAADRRTETVHGIALSSTVASEDPESETVLITWEVMNASSVAFDDVVIHVLDPCSPRHLLEQVVGTVLPSRSVSGECTVPRPSGSLPFRWFTAPAALVYVDPWGQAWRRHAGPPAKLSTRPRVC